MAITLYVTDACSLCDKALAMLLASDHLAGSVLEVIDIVSDNTLFERLADKIPVVAMSDTELEWPFSIEDVVELCDGE